MQSSPAFSSLGVTISSLACKCSLWIQWTCESQEAELTGQHRKTNQADLIWCKLKKRNPHLLITFEATQHSLPLFFQHDCPTNLSCMCNVRQCVIVHLNNLNGFWQYWSFPGYFRSLAGPARSPLPSFPVDGRQTQPTLVVNEVCYCTVHRWGLSSCFN